MLLTAKEIISKLDRQNKNTCSGQKMEKTNQENWGKIDILCYGHFNVIHPGHLRYIQFAAKQGSSLGVLLKSDEMLLKTDQGGAFFSYSERRDLLENVPIPKTILSTESGSFFDNIKRILPKKIVLGHEFQDNNEELTVAARIFCQNNGIEILFHSGHAFNSLWHYASDPVTEHVERCRVAFNSTCNRRSIQSGALEKLIQKFANLSVMVIGDTIVDKFIFCDPLGVSSEAPVLVVKEQNSSTFVGGAGIVAKHIVSLGAKCSLVSVLGADDAGSFVTKDVESFGINNDFVVDNNRPTTLKTRYIADGQKVFRSSVLEESDVDETIEAKIIEAVASNIRNLDCLILSDFVYGVVTPKVVREVSELAKTNNVRLFGDLQCSSQIGNVLKFRGFDMIFPTEREARLALENKDDSLEFVSRRLLEESLCKNLVIKLGKDGLVAYERHDGDSVISEHFPALSVSPVDVAGAGDSLLATMALAIGAGASVMEASALGSIVASCAVERMGNVPVSKNDLLASLNSLEL